MIRARGEGGRRQEVAPDSAAWGKAGEVTAAWAGWGERSAAPEGSAVGRAEAGGGERRTPLLPSSRQGDGGDGGGDGGTGGGRAALWERQAVVACWGKAGMSRPAMATVRKAGLGGPGGEGDLGGLRAGWGGGAGLDGQGGCGSGLGGAGEGGIGLGSGRGGGGNGGSGLGGGVCPGEGGEGDGVAAGCASETPATAVTRSCSRPAALRSAGLCRCRSATPM